MPGAYVCQLRWLFALYGCSRQAVAVAVADEKLRQLLLSAMQCGLDRGKRGSHTPIEEQEAIFEQQLQMAQELNRPVSVGGLHLPQHSVWTAWRTQLQLLWLVECLAAMSACFAGPDVHTAGTRRVVLPEGLASHSAGALCATLWQAPAAAAEAWPIPGRCAGSTAGFLCSWPPCSASLLTQRCGSARLWGRSAWTVTHAGVVLHSWAGSADMTQMLAKVEGVHFSISGHLTALKRVKAEAMLQQVCAEKPCLAAA